MEASSSSSVHVVVRVRPQNNDEIQKGGTLAVKFGNGDKGIQVESGGGENKFTFDCIFDSDSSQSAVFDSIGIPLVKNVFEGYNGTIFAYGQTSSGKTYTMQGPDIADEQLAGVIPRTVQAIFETISRAGENMEFTVRGSYVEIYLERIRDLLDPSRQNLQVREDPSRGIYVEGMSEQYVNSLEEMMELMELGASNRAQAATGMNEGSSRSHSVFVLQLVQTDTKTHTTKTSKINLVDLAGSEMVRKTGATGARLAEAKMINSSLSALGKVINALTDGKSSHIPYRDSKLTRMLQESLGGNARTWLVINVSPSSYNAAETLNTLRFGNRAKAIQNKAVVNQIRTVEELEALLAQAERAIDVQSQYIDNLKSKLSAGGGGSLVMEDQELAQRLAQLEEKVKELEELHQNDVQEQQRSETEIEILTEQVAKTQDELEESKQIVSKLSAQVDESVDVNSKHIELREQFEQLQFQHKELNLSLTALQTENKKLTNELDSLPAGTANLVERTSTVSDEDESGDDIGDPNARISKLQDQNRKLKLELSSKQQHYESVIQQLEAKVSGSTVAQGIDPALEQRLYQLIAVHKSLLRKYAASEINSAEKEQLLSLKDERIQMLEGRLKSKEYNLKAQAERHALEVEELNLDRQRQVQQLQLEIIKQGKEKTSFGSKALSLLHRKTVKSPGHGNQRIVKPLRGGSVLNRSSSSFSSDQDETLV
mmetsp:Transcript_45158/g.72346  ORF Transcript_45158/g.72346 Transcript_45158/m.72346 type:complete len:713 (-) Transcript_45158:2281-4419(-)